MQLKICNFALIKSIGTRYTEHTEGSICKTSRGVGIQTIRFSMDLQRRKLWSSRICRRYNTKSSLNIWTISQGGTTFLISPLKYTVKRVPKVRFCSCNSNGHRSVCCCCCCCCCLIFFSNQYTFCWIKYLFNFFILFYFILFYFILLFSYFFIFLFF